VTKIETLLRLARRGHIRARDLDVARIPRAYLARLVSAGRLVHVARGLYRLPAPEYEASSVDPLAAVAARVPNGVICLSSALAFHGLIDVHPPTVWVMIETRARCPKLDDLNIKVVRASGEAFTHGVERWMGLAGRMRVTSPAKTVADCFRYIRRVGEPLAHAALAAFEKEVRRQRRRAQAGKPFDADFTRTALEDAARVDRVGAHVREASMSRLPKQG
jgi:predicted transcriptional regulator of viral defense system